MLIWSVVSKMVLLFGSLSPGGLRGKAVFVNGLDLWMN